MLLIMNFYYLLREALSLLFELFNKSDCKPLHGSIVLITNESTKKVLLINF